jgi:hypothetical protein
VVKERAAGAQQAAIPAGGATTNASSIDADDGHAGAQALVDAGQSASAQTHHTGVCLKVARERRPGRAAGGIPDRRSRIQK